MPAWIPVPDEEGHPLYWVWTREIEKSNSDDRKYRLIRLPNDLQALLIYDPQSDVSATAMNVGIGYFDDPPATESDPPQDGEMQGMAHLCEHLLFMGSGDKGGKGEDDFFKYVKGRGGSGNAFTTATNTCFFFTIGTDYLSEAIDLFHGFFSSPSFHTSNVTGELSIVNSEYEKNLQSDPQRLFQLFKSEARKGHPWRKFATGTTQSLTPTNVVPPAENVDEERRERLYKWWKDKYSPAIMGLVILGGKDANAESTHEPLDSLITKALKFSDIQVSSPPPTLSVVTEPPWGAEQRCKITFAETRTDIKILEVYFCLPWLDHFYKSKPATFISRLIELEAKDSLYDYLTTEPRQWITQITSQPLNPARGFSFLRIQTKLTQSGLENYQSVLEAVYAYLYLLVDGVKKPDSDSFWRNFSEQLDLFAALQNNLFQYSEKEGAKCHVNRLSESLLRPWPKELLLKAPTVVLERDFESLKGSVKGILSVLQPELGSVVLSSRNALSIAKKYSSKPVECLEECWYKTKYFRTNLKQELFHKARLITCMYVPAAKLPSTNFRIKHHEHSSSKYPTRKKMDGERSQLWFKQGEKRFKSPKGYIGVYIRSPVARKPAEGDHPSINAVMSKLVECLIRDVLTEKFYEESLAGYYCSLVYDEDGNFIVQAGGYTDKILHFLRERLHCIKYHPIKEDIVSTYKDQLKKSFKNAQLCEPSVIAHQLMDCCLRNLAWTAKEMEHAIDSILPGDVPRHRDNLLNYPAKNTLLVLGNFQNEDTNGVHQTIDELLTKPNETDVRSVTTMVDIEQENWVYIQPLLNHQETNNAVEYYLQIADRSAPDVPDPLDKPDADSRAKLYAKLFLFAHLINEPFFKAIRTDEQLGYNVSSAAWIQATCAGMLFRVQSDKTGLEIEKSIEDFLRPDVLKAVSNDFTSRRDALTKAMQQHPDNQDQETARFAFPILAESLLPDGENYDFELRDRVAKEIETLEYEKDIKEGFYEIYIEKQVSEIHKPSWRAKVSIHALSGIKNPKELEATKEYYERHGYDVFDNLKEIKKRSTKLPQMP